MATYKAGQLMSTYKGTYKPGHRPIYNNSAPKKKLILPNICKEKFVRKLVFLHNHLMQYYGVSYEEVIVVYERPSFVMTEPSPVIYYEPTAVILESNAEPHLFSVYNILFTYMVTGLLSKFDMQYTNVVWQWLKEKAGITTE